MKRYSFNVKGKCKPKQRPRFVRSGSRVITFTPKETQDFEKIVAKTASLFIKEKLKGPLCVTICFFFESPKKTKTGYPRPDIDNLAKTVLDGLNGIAFEDDSQVVSLTLQKAYGPEDFVQIIVSEPSQIL